MKLAKGNFGSRGNVWTVAKNTVEKGLCYAYAHRALKKRTFRSLWITRINAAARLNGMNYSKLINGLKKAGVDINRKMLAELAVYNAEAFTQLTEVAKKSLS